MGLSISCCGRGGEWAAGRVIPLAGELLSPLGRALVEYSTWKRIISSLMQSFSAVSSTDVSSATPLSLTDTRWRGSARAKEQKNVLFAVTSSVTLCVNHVDCESVQRDSIDRGGQNNGRWQTVSS